MAGKEEIWWCVSELPMMVRACVCAAVSLQHGMKLQPRVCVCVCVCSGMKLQPRACVCLAGLAGSGAQGVRVGGAVRVLSPLAAVGHQ